MNKISYAVKINSSLVSKIKLYCVVHGIKQGFFVEKALKEQLAREELRDDLLDLKTLRLQEDSAINFEEYLKKKV